MELFITCAHGLEEVVAEEIQQLGYNQVQTGYRGVFTTVSGLNDVYRLNYCLRTATRVLLPLRKFRCYDDQSLYKETKKIDWIPFFTKAKTLAIDANVHHQKITNSLYASQVVKDAICDQIRDYSGHRPSVDLKDPDVQVHLYVHEGWGTLSFDTSGSSLNKRGYRQETVEAPMQETLAAALLKLIEFQGTETFFDPCCGSGTLLIEAALIATHTPPGFLRKQWGFFHHPDFTQEYWLKVKNSMDDHRRPLPEGQISGIDVNKKAVFASKVNLRAIGFHKQISVTQEKLEEFIPKTPLQIIVTNPPHGKRLEEETLLIPLYRAIGDFMKHHTQKPAKGGVFTSSPLLSKEVGLATKKRHVLFNGGMECRFLEFELWDESNKK